LHSPSQRAFALVGPGRAGTTIGTALVARGWTARAVAGRTVDADSTRRVARKLGAAVVEVEDAGHDELLCEDPR
jgi:glutamyl-tRNA reductase